MTVWLANGVRVTDAFVSFFGTRQELHVVADQGVVLTDLRVLNSDDATGPWVGATEGGVYCGWQVDPPLAESQTMETWVRDGYDDALRCTLPINGVDVDVYQVYGEKLVPIVNALDGHDAISVRIHREKYGRSASPRVVATETAQRIIDEYVNGPEGSSSVSMKWYEHEVWDHRDYWDHIDDGYDRSVVEPYADVEVALVRHADGGWKPEAVNDLSPDDEVYTEVNDE